MPNGKPPVPSRDPIEIATQLVEGLGPQMRRLRKTRQMTQLDLGKAAHLGVDHVGKLERGGTCPKLQSVGQIAAGLNVPIAHLLDPLGEAQRAEASGPLVELVDYMRHRQPEDSVLALSILRQIFDRCG